MKSKKAITLIITIEMILMTAAAPLCPAVVYADPGTPGATEIALDLYGNNEYSRNGSRRDADQSNGKNSARDSGKDSSKDSSRGGQKDTKDANKNTGLAADSRHYAEALAQSCVPLTAATADQNTGADKFTLSGGSRFYIVSDEMPSEELIGTVRLMDSQFAAYGLPADEPLAVVYGKAGRIEKGDIVIRLVPEEEMEAAIDGTIKTADISEAYTLRIGGQQAMADANETADTADAADTAGGTAVITACGSDGIYYGLLTLMEMMRSKQGEGYDMSLDGALITDGPDLAERAVLLDCGRRYFSREWIENFIRRASMQRYNAIVMHFSEMEGLRLDSRVFPWLTKGIESLTMDEMTEIIRTARDYHMEVIPSFDMPGHNTYIVKRYADYVSGHPDLSFECDGRTYDSSVKGFGSIANHWSNNGETRKADYIGIDVTKKHAAAFIEALADDYADFFAENGCTKFDMGGDELLGWYSFELGGESFSFNNRWKALDHWAQYAKTELGISKGSAADTYVDFLNTMGERLEAKGFTCRVFNDDLDLSGDQHIGLNRSIEVTYWFPANNSAGHFAKAGHRVHNFVENWCFYVLRSSNGRDIMDGKYRTVNGTNIFENWDPRAFSGAVNSGKEFPRGRLAGGYFAIWCDHPDYKSDKEIWEETEMKMWANASKMWNPEVSTGRSGIGSGVSYDEMRAFALGMEGYPGYSGKTGKPASLPRASEPEASGSWWRDLISF